MPLHLAMLDELIAHLHEHIRRDCKSEAASNPIIKVFIPITRPSTSKSGPPLLPGLMNASVWM
jgi:hypothetical protein